MTPGCPLPHGACVIRLGGCCLGWSCPRDDLVPSMKAFCMSVTTPIEETGLGNPQILACTAQARGKTGDCMF